MKTHRTLLLASFMTALLGGCGINEMPSYKNLISAVQLSPEIDSSAQVLFTSPADVDPYDPDAVAVEVMETRIRERLAERLDRLAHPSILSGPFESSLVDRFSRVFPWTLSGAEGAYDVLFRIDVRHYGVEVDENGLASVFYDIAIKGLFAPTSTVIYEDSVRSAMALTEIYQGYDPVSAAAARAMNLMALDQLSDGEFQALVIQGADWAVKDLFSELFDDTFRD